MTRQRMAANGRAGVTSTGAEGGKREAIGRSILTGNSTPIHNPRHAPSRAILRCPSCGTTIRVTGPDPLAQLRDRLQREEWRR